jgi:hypothetical protein
MLALATVTTWPEGQRTSTAAMFAVTVTGTKVDDDREEDDEGVDVSRRRSSRRHA